MISHENMMQMELHSNRLVKYASKKIGNKSDIGDDCTEKIR